MPALRDMIDKAFNWSGGAYVGLSTLVVLGMAVAEFVSGTPMVVSFPDGRSQIYIVHAAPAWFTSAIGIYTVILGLFVAARPVNTYIAQKGNPPPTPAPAPEERPLEK